MKPAGNTTARVARMYYGAYARGATLEEVGRELGVSKERVRQLFNEAGLRVRSRSETVRLKRQFYLEDADRVVKVFRDLGEAGAVARELRIPRAVVQQIVRECTAELDRRRPRKRANVYSDDDLTDCLRQASKVLGGHLTVTAYIQHAQDARLAGGASWPSYRTVTVRFGSWRGALAAAGLSAGSSSSAGRPRRFHAASCVSAVRHVARQLGKAPTSAEYERYARTSGTPLPSLSTVRCHCGQWYDALRLAGL